MELLTNIGAAKSHIPKSLVSLASLGAWGHHAGNCNQELKAFLGESDYPQPQQVPINVKVHKPRTRRGFGHSLLQRVMLPFILPHLVFAFFFSGMRSNFDAKMFGPEGAEDRIHDFWSEVVHRRDPRLARHPMCDKIDWMRRAIPLVIHGDAVPVVKVGRPGTKSFDCLSWASLLASGHTLKVKNWMFGLFEQNKGVDTMDEVWRVLMWSFRALYEGEHPRTDWDGNAWPDKSLEA